MSRIAACYSWDAPVDRELLESMLQKMALRGEVAAWWVRGSVGLASLQHASSKNPLDMEQGEPCPIAADARLDYRTNLLKRLRAETPVVLANLSDAQLIAASYQQWGEACVNYLEGDYAFVLWDHKQQRIFGARSIVGLRPFVYYVTPQRFLCASEPGQLLADPTVSCELNQTWVAFWLTQGQGHWDGTIYQEINTLPPGHLILVDATGVTITSFWQPPARFPVREGRQAEYIEQFYVLLTDAVRTRLDGARRLFFDLSGGLDSSSLVSLAGLLWEQAEKRYPLDCFHAVSDGSLPYVQAVASRYPTIRIHTVSWHSHGHFDGAFDPAPWMALPCRPTLLLSSLYQQQWRLAAELGAQAHIRGDFGDELLGASLDYLWIYWKERHLGAVMREMKQWCHIAGLSPRTLLEQWVIHPSLHQLHLQHLTQPEQPIPWLRPGVLEQHKAREAQDEQYFRQRCPEPLARELFRWMYFHTDYTIQADVARKMAGLETREPFADLRLITFLLSTPPQCSIRPDQGKYLLREAMRGVIPEKVRLREGKGRAYRHYFQGFKKHREELRQAVTHMPELLMPYIDPGALLDAIDGVALGGQVHVPAMSGTLSLLLWAHRLPWANGSLPVASEETRE